MLKDSRYALGPLILDAGSKSLLHDQNLLPLGERAVSVLLLLIQRAGQLVTKDQLITGAWNGLVVEEGNLAVQIAALRRALANIPGADRWIVTLPRRGYRFDGPVTHLNHSADNSNLSERNESWSGDAPKIAVLPFENLGDFGNNNRIIDGIVTDVINALSNVQSISVIGRNLSLQYRERPADVKKIACELGVRYVLDGTVRKDSDRARVTVELVEATSGIQLWAGRFDGTFEDIFALQDHIAASVLTAIEPRLLFAEVNRADRGPVASLRAYDLFLRATGHFYAMTREDLEIALALLNRSIVVDPAHARSYGLLGRCYLHRKVRGWVPPGDPSIAEGARCARIAVDKGGDNPEVLWMAAIGVGLAGGDIAGAVALVDRSLALNPSSAEALTYSGMLRAYLGDCDTALEHIARSSRLSPIDAQTYNKLTAAAFAHFMCGRLEAALEASERALSYKHDYEPPRRMRTACLGLLGRDTEAGGGCGTARGESE